MKILHLSDIHLEFQEMAAPKTDADVVVLSGDIAIGTDAIDWAAQFPQPVITILGNHEAYGGEPLDKLIVRCRGRAKEYSHVHFLENESIVIEDVQFHGATFWTDFELNGHAAESMKLASALLNDYRRIRIHEGRFTPEIAAKLHRTSRLWLYQSLLNSTATKNVVVTHHLPCATAVQPKYWGSNLSPAFASECPEFSQLSDKISIWLYGHNHDCRAFMYNNICYSTNQRGYAGHELVQGFNPNRLVEI